MVLAETSVEETYRPRYREIEQAIRQRLARLKPGAELPSDAQLCEEFAVSRMTARHAMQGRIPSSRLLGRALRVPTREEATRLQLKDGEKLLWLKRIRLADGHPIALESTRLHRRTAAAVLAADLQSESLHAVLVRAGCLPTKGRATIDAEPAGADDARWLKMRKGDPMLVERRVILDQQGRPLEFTESRYPADRYALDVDFVVEDQGRKS